MAMRFKLMFSTKMQFLLRIELKRNPLQSGAPVYVMIYSFSLSVFIRNVTLARPRNNS